MGSNIVAKSKISKVLNKYASEHVTFAMNYLYLVKNYNLKQYIYECFNENMNASFSISHMETPYDDMILRQACTQDKKINIGIITANDNDVEELILCNTYIEYTKENTIITLYKIKMFSKTETNHILCDLEVSLKDFSEKAYLLNLYKHIQSWRPERLSKVETTYRDKYKLTCQQLFKLEAIAYTRYRTIMPVEYNEPASSINTLNSTLLFDHVLLSNADSTNFTSPSDYFHVWSQGLYKHYELRPTSYRKILKCYQDAYIREYMKLLFEKNYYEQIYTRERYKVPETLRTLFLFDNRNLLAFLVNPSKIKTEQGVENYAITIPKTPYNYFTVKHLLTTGVYSIKDMTMWTHIQVKNYQDFYFRVKNISNSPYEKAFIDCYIRYVEEQKDKGDIPLLIPEFRYDGINEKHSYRLDFLILNFYTNERIGIELSPSSTHINSKDYKSQWERENDKRNAFFSRYGITLVTFTDAEMKNIHNCFNRIIPYLSIQNKNDIDVSIQEKLLSIKIVE